MKQKRQITISSVKLKRAILTGLDKSKLGIWPSTKEDIANKIMRQIKKQEDQ